MVADLFAIVSPEGKSSTAGCSMTGTCRKRFSPPDVIEGIRDLAKGMPVESLAARGAFLRFGSQPMVIAVSRITPFMSDPDIDPAKLPFFVAGLELTDERLGNSARASLSTISISRSAWTRPAGRRGDCAACPRHLRRDHRPLPLDAADARRRGAAERPPADRRRARALLHRRLRHRLPRPQDRHRAHREREGSPRRRPDRRDDRAQEPDRLQRTARLARLPGGVQGGRARGHLSRHQRLQGGQRLDRPPRRRRAGQGADGPLEVGASARTRSFARIGGDEFAVALLGKAVRDTAAGAASAIVHSLDQPFTIHGFEFHVTVAVGYAVAGGTGLTPGEIVRRADIAMYHAKNGAEREAVAYHSTMETGALEKKQVETALRRAVEEGDLRVFYQPVVRASDLSIVGVEALVRWTSKEFGTVSPSLFIPVAEETGLIHDIGRFVVDRACQDLLRWPGLKMAINVSPVQLRDPNFADDILGDRRPLRPEPAPVRARADRGHPGQQPDHRQAQARASQEPRLHPVARRFRHRLLLDRLPAPVPLRHPQGRPLLRPRSRHQLDRQRAHPVAGFARRCDGPVGHRRGHRERGPAQAAPPRPVRIRAGLPDQPADPGRRRSRRCSPGSGRSAGSRSAGSRSGAPRRAERPASANVRRIACSGRDSINQVRDPIAFNGCLKPSFMPP